MNMTGASVTIPAPDSRAFRESHVHWLGPVPQHWTVVQLGFRYSVELGKMLDSNRITGDHLKPYLRNVDVQWVLKATKVDGVYSADPKKDPKAERYDKLGYDEVINNKLAVMDTTAIVLCRDNKLPIRVYNMNKAGALMNIVQGRDEGTLVI